MGDSALAQRRENAADVCCRPKKSIKIGARRARGPRRECAARRKRP
ncbi:hypothetical protein BURPS1655_0470 [Burkholderia pseudomallei 1655]|nr:hypothetical protein BURPS1655_0470 [Burkholderia pseudomallei 1655]